MSRLPGAVGCAYHECANEQTHVQFSWKFQGELRRVVGVAWDVCFDHAALAAAVCADPRIADRARQLAARLAQAEATR
jgi:hypothetical protein